ncbi:DnaJ domain-containing protein [Rathayibacter sp. YIM 133350]|uniref:J domain-containing protein n=1 Tax=Rathayibacter sp. YIM 133350 TaxID=3131992 RepID=UPI00307D27C0
MSPERAAAILEIPVTATSEQIRSAYRAKARNAHPDRYAGATDQQKAAAAAEFIRVTEAYEELIRRPPESRPWLRDEPRPPWSPAASRQAAPAPSVSPRVRSFWRWTAILVASLLALLFSSGSVGLSPGTFGVAANSPWFVPVMVVAEAVCLLATVACALYAATGRRALGRAAGILAGIVIAAFFVASLTLAPFTVSTLFFATFGTAITMSPFLALLLMGRMKRERG